MLEAGHGYTENGTGEGSFTGKITGLMPESVYYVRAYAVNDTGTTYGKQVTVTTLHNVAPGDVNGNGIIDLNDAILILKLIAGINPNVAIRSDADINGDGKIGLEEVIFVLQRVSGVR
jgi:hypothetical protein